MGSEHYIVPYKYCLAEEEPDFTRLINFKQRWQHQGSTQHKHMENAYS